MRAWAAAWPEMASLPNDPIAFAEARRRAFAPFLADIPEEMSAFYELILKSSGGNIMNTTAALRDTQALLAAIEIRHKTGSYPADISQIPGKWIDPFTGKPLLLKRAGEGIRIYSIGPNGKDDGGLMSWEKGGKGSDDVVVSYPPSSKGW